MRTDRDNLGEEEEEKPFQLGECSDPAYHLAAQEPTLANTGGNQRGRGTLGRDGAARETCHCLRFVEFVFFLLAAHALAFNTREQQLANRNSRVSAVLDKHYAMLKSEKLRILPNFIQSGINQLHDDNFHNCELNLETIYKSSCKLRIGFGLPL